MIGIVLLLVVILAFFNVFAPKGEEKLEGEIITLGKSTSTKMANTHWHLKMPHYSNLHFKRDPVIAMKTVDKLSVNDGYVVKEMDVLAILNTGDIKKM